jgi:guanine nucleotide-binding protein subunit alpha
MGCAPSKTEDGMDKEAAKRNANIDKLLRMDKKNFDRTVKILLLGKWLFCIHTPINDPFND